MQETQNYKLKKIDKETDKILDSIDYLNQNFDDIDTEVSNLSTNITASLGEAKKYADEEIAKFDFIKIVDTLPETGLPNRFYFVPKTDTQTQDLFDEYAWINEAWEWITTKQIEVDLTSYAKIKKITQTEYDALTSYDSQTLYCLPEE